MYISIPLHNNDIFETLDEVTQHEREKRLQQLEQQRQRLTSDQSYEDIKTQKLLSVREKLLTNSRQGQEEMQRAGREWELAEKQARMSLEDGKRMIEELEKKRQDLMQGLPSNTKRARHS